MKSKWSRIALVGCLALLLAACGQVNAPAVPADITSSPTAILPVSGTQSGSGTALPMQENGAQMTQSTLPPVSPGLESLIEKAKEELAQKLSIQIAQIELVEAKEVVWPDASIGCPQPGMRYIQVPYDGALIILEAQGDTFEYHVGGNRGLFLCEKVYKDLNTPPKIDITNLTPPGAKNNNATPPTPDKSIPPGEDQ
jgi:hypothetical protein